MSKLTVYDMKGASVGDIDLSDDLLVIEKGEQAVQDVVVAYLAGRRAGTASTLRKGEVAGSGKKPWRQKGTGRARAGYRQSPVWRGGAVAFGPHPRSYAKKVNKKVARLAFRRALSDRVNAGDVKVIDSLVLDDAKTKSFAVVLKSLEITGPALFILDSVPRELALASRNISKVEVVNAADANVYQLVRYPTIVVSKDGMKVIESRLTPESGAKK